MIPTQGQHTVKLVGPFLSQVLIPSVLAHEPPRLVGPAWAKVVNGRGLPEDNPEPILTEIRLTEMLPEGAAPLAGTIDGDGGITHDFMPAPRQSPRHLNLTGLAPADTPDDR